MLEHDATLHTRHGIERLMYRGRYSAETVSYTAPQPHPRECPCKRTFYLFREHRSGTFTPVASPSLSHFHLSRRVQLAARARCRWLLMVSAWATLRPRVGDAASTARSCWSSACAGTLDVICAGIEDDHPELQLTIFSLGGTAFLSGLRACCA
jgi:hypothetical protein